MTDHEIPREIMTIKIPLSAPDIGEPEIAAVHAVLRSSRLSLGAKLVEFETVVADFVGCAHAVAISSGTAALHLALIGAGISAGDEVIVPSFAFIAVANAVRYVGAIPVFVDIEERTLNLAPSAVESAITGKTRAILVVHTFGVPAAMSALLEIARRHNLQLIEDACEALGGQYQGRQLGSLGCAGVFGFYPNKQITTGEGGILVTNDPRIAARARSLRNQGRGETGDWFEHLEIGYNYRLSEINCALGVAQMQRLPEILEKRAAVAQMYFAALKPYSHIKPPLERAADGKISWFVYVVRLAQEFQGARRDAVVAAMRARGIECARYFAPIHLQRAYRGVPHRCMDLTATEALSERTLALPFFNQLSLVEVREVCATLQEVLARV